MFHTLIGRVVLAHFIWVGHFEHKRMLFTYLGTCHDRNVRHSGQISVNSVDLLLIMFAPKNKWLCYITCIVHFVFSVLIMSVLVHTHHRHMYVSKLLVHTLSICVHREAFGTYIHQYMYIRKKLLVHRSSIHVHKQEAFGTHTPQPMYISRNLLKPWIQSHWMNSTDETSSVFWFLKLNTCICMIQHDKKAFYTYFCSCIDDIWLVSLYSVMGNSKG
jgi:hypothetical protein